MADISIEQVIASPSLPSLPKVAMDVLELTSNPDIDLNEIAKVVQNDQALCAKVLKTINSSYYALAEPCTTISRAMVYLGINTVKSLVLSFSLVDVSSRSDDDFDLIDYWRRCVHSAAAARRIGQLTCQCDPDEAFTAALLQDIGMLAIHSAIGAEYERLIEIARYDHRKLARVESQELGFSHMEAGARLGERWKLPPSLVESIREHHGMCSGEDGDRNGSITTIVQMSYRAAIALTSSGGSSELQTVQSLGDRFGMSLDQVKELLKAVTEDGRSLSNLLRVKVGEAINVGSIMAEAEDQRIVHTLNVDRQVTELRQAADQLAAEALTDGLTGIANRKRFDEELARCYDGARTMGGCFGVILIDGDRFKLVNDKHGHQAGDAVLVELARRITKGAGDDGVVCRYGGEEFAVLIPGANLARTASIAEAIRATIAASAFSLADVACQVDELPITASLGGAAFEPKVSGMYVKPEIIVTAADKALYAAKESGRNCVRMFSPRVKAA